MTHLTEELLQTKVFKEEVDKLLLCKEWENLVFTM